MSCENTLELDTKCFGETFEMSTDLHYNSGMIFFSLQTTNSYVHRIKAKLKNIKYLNISGNIGSSIMAVPSNPLEKFDSLMFDKLINLIYLNLRNKNL